MRRPTQPAVRQLAEAVKRLGYSVWWDEELPPHLSYSDVITEKIDAAKAAIVVWSEEAAASQWVRAEADAARNQKKLIQTSIDGRMPPMPFNQIQFAAIGDWHGEDDHPGWMKVKASLEALVGPRPRGDRRRPAPPPAGAAPPPHKWHKLLIAVIALSFLFIAGAGLFAWLRGGAPTAPVQTSPPIAPPAAASRAVDRLRHGGRAAAPGPRPGRATRRRRRAPSARRARRHGVRDAIAGGRGGGTPECARGQRARRGRRR